jgi:hypothetical protein
VEKLLRNRLCTHFWDFAENFGKKSPFIFPNHDNTEQFRTITEYVCGNKRHLLYVIAEIKVKFLWVEKKIGDYFSKKKKTAFILSNLNELFL